jgi:hypothetical protein
LFHLCETWTSSLLQHRFSNQDIFMQAASFTCCLSNSILMSITVASVDRMSAWNTTRDLDTSWVPLGWINYHSFDFLPCWTIRKSNFSLQIKFQEKRHTDSQAMRFPSVYIRWIEWSPSAKSNICITNIYIWRPLRQLLTKLLRRLYCCPSLFMGFGGFVNSRGRPKNKDKISLDFIRNV